VHHAAHVRIRVRTSNLDVRFGLEIDVTDLLPEMQEAPPSTTTPYVDLPDDGMDLNAYLSSLERDLIRRALERTRGNRNKASELLHIKRTTLVEKMKRLGLE
jgi:DNA-binding NtrC family response regulator